MSGSEQAAAVVSAAVLLVRQYLREGFYPLGYRDAGARLQPSAALVKALVLNGAVPPARTYTPDGRPEDARTLLTPNVLGGFGRVELAGVLRMSVEDMQLSDCKCLSDNAFFFAVDDVGPTSKQDPATWRRTLFPADYGSRCADTLNPKP